MNDQSSHSDYDEKLERRVIRLEEGQKHFATREDIADFKRWLVAGAFGLVSTGLLAAFAILSRAGAFDEYFSPTPVVVPVPTATATPTAIPTPTATATPTTTSTPTSTPIPTRTPISAIITPIVTYPHTARVIAANGLDALKAPDSNAEVAYIIPLGAQIALTGSRMTNQSVEWSELIDGNWVQTQFLRMN